MTFFSSCPTSYCRASPSHRGMPQWAQVIGETLRPAPGDQKNGNVCFGSLADITACSARTKYVRFSPKSGHFRVELEVC